MCLAAVYPIGVDFVFRDKDKVFSVCQVDKMKKPQKIRHQVKSTLCLIIFRFPIVGEKSSIIFAPPDAGTLQLLLQREHDGQLGSDVGVEPRAQQIGVDVTGTDDILRLAVDFLRSERIDECCMT